MVLTVLASLANYIPARERKRHCRELKATFEPSVRDYCAFIDGRSGKAFISNTSLPSTGLKFRRQQYRISIGRKVEETFITTVSVAQLFYHGLRYFLTCCMLWRCIQRYCGRKHSRGSKNYVRSATVQYSNSDGDFVALWRRNCQVSFDVLNYLLRLTLIR